MCMIIHVQLWHTKWFYNIYQCMYKCICMYSNWYHVDLWWLPSLNKTQNYWPVYWWKLFNLFISGLITGTGVFGYSLLLDASVVYMNSLGTWQWGFLCTVYRAQPPCSGKSHCSGSDPAHSPGQQHQISSHGEYGYSGNISYKQYWSFF